MTKKKLETELQSQIIDYLTLLENQNKLWFTRINVIPPVQYVNGKMVFRRMPKGAKTGIADLLILKDSQTIWVELKAEGKTKLSETQEKFAEAVQSFSDGEYHVINSFEQFKNLIN